MAKQFRIILHDDTLGVTQPALKALRDELSRRVDHKVAVLQVPSAAEEKNECVCYGLTLVDDTTRELVIIGDGFRGDGGGEGGAGSRAAQALIHLFGIRPMELMPEEAIAFTDDASMYKPFADHVLEMVEAESLDFVVPSFTRPQYIDWILNPR